MYKTITKCRCCDHGELKQILDLKDQPLANTYHQGQLLPTYPLQLNLCTNCFHSQLNIVVDPNELFTDYKYVSGTTKTLHDYFDWFADMVQTDLQKVGSVLDIACNDGTQLSKFKNRGWKTYGVDPAKNLAEFSSKYCTNLYVGFFNRGAIDELGLQQFDAIIAQNVFAHVDDVADFLEVCKFSMHDNSILYIQTSQADMIENNQFDTIYHEHLSFFSTQSMIALCSRVGLCLRSIERTSVHGGSYVFKITKTGFSDQTVLDSLELETQKGRYNLKQYETYKKNVESIALHFAETVNDYMSKGFLIIGYGAAAKGNTFLNFSRIKPHFIIDDNPHKHNLLLPGINSIIKPASFILELAHDTLFVPLAWNFYDEITQKITLQLAQTQHRKLYSYLCYRYFPTQHIVFL